MLSRFCQQRPALRPGFFGTIADSNARISGVLLLRLGTRRVATSADTLVPSPLPQKASMPSADFQNIHATRRKHGELRLEPKLDQLQPPPGKHSCELRHCLDVIETWG
jgi:hypothetical protein